MFEKDLQEVRSVVLGELACCSAGSSYSLHPGHLNGELAMFLTLGKDPSCFGVKVLFSEAFPGIGFPKHQLACEWVTELQ